MTGQVKFMIDRLISEKSKGDRFIENGIRVKLILRGIDVDSYTESSCDGEVDINKVKEAASEFGIAL